MIQQTISNFYIPGYTKRIFAKLQEVGINNDSWSEDEDEENSENAEIPFGIIDGSNINSAYSELIESLEISKMTNQEIRTFVKNSLINNFKINIPVWLKISEDEKKANEDMENDSNGNRTAIDVVFYWRRFHYSIKSIAAKLSISKEKVREILSKYKAKVKKIWIKNKRNSKGLRYAIKSSHLNAIKDYWVATVNNPIKIKNIKEHVWPRTKWEKAPHNSTISRILHNELNMSYKVLQRKNPITRTSNNVRLFHESIAVQTLLRIKGYELIYVDEFHYSSLK